MARIETGPHQCNGNNWPGYFLRGDDAVMNWAQTFRHLADAIDGKNGVPLSAFPDKLRRMAAELESCWVKR